MQGMTAQVRGSPFTQPVSDVRELWLDRREMVPARAELIEVELVGRATHTVHQPALTVNTKEDKWPFAEDANNGSRGAAILEG